MNNVYKHPAWWQNASATQPPEPPDDMLERVLKIESILPTLATKEDLANGLGSLRAEMHKEFTVQTWRIFAFVTTFVTTISAALVAAVYFIAKNVH